MVRAGFGFGSVFAGRLPVAKIRTAVLTEATVFRCEFAAVRAYDLSVEPFSALFTENGVCLVFRMAVVTNDHVYFLPFAR